MDIKNSSGLVGKYNDRDVYVLTRKEYDNMNCDSNSYYILKDHPTIEGHPMLLFRGKIKGYCKNDGGIKIYDRDVYYVRASANENEFSMKNRREYKYTMKDVPQPDKKEFIINLDKMCASVSEHIRDGLATGNKLLKEEQ